MKLISHISGYKFIDLKNLIELRQRLSLLCNTYNLKGTILLATEGINIMLSGEYADVDQFIIEFQKISGFTEIEFKMTHPNHIPFKRLLVKIKKEIITFGMTGVSPSKQTGKRLPVQTFKEWLDQNKDMTILDVRNRYEIAEGKFIKAIDLGIDHFRFLPKALEKLSPELKQKPTVLYCTGGIRCEKASSYMIQQGFTEVYQLEGGILKYFSDCGNAHYEGKCFVFDERVVLPSE